jgi:type IV pilus assembly protein PilC
VEHACHLLPLPRHDAAFGREHPEVSLNPQLRRASKEIVDELRKGTEISVAMQSQTDCFPELMVDLISVAEQTGTLPEVLASLADHYDNLVRLRRTRLS